MDCIKNGTILSHCVLYIVCYMSEAGFNNSLDCMLPSGGEILSQVKYFTRGGVWMLRNVG